MMNSVALSGFTPALPFIAGLCLCFAPLPAAAEEVAPPPPAAVKAADQFYQTFLKLNTRGLPPEREMVSYIPLLSPDLVKMIEAARLEQKKTPAGEKPPWVDDNLFASCYEGVHSYSLGAPQFHADKASIPVYMSHTEGKDSAKWIDVIVMVQMEGRWVVWDIFMNAPWDFRSGPTLRAMLQL